MFVEFFFSSFTEFFCIISSFNEFKRALLRFTALQVRFTAFFSFIMIFVELFCSSLTEFFCITSSFNELFCIISSLNEL